MNSYFTKRTMLLLATFSILLIGCNHKDESNPATKAPIKGNVNLFDSGTKPMPKNDMLISIEGSNPLVTAVTDTSGAFAFDSIPFGTYNLVFSKLGYGTYKHIGLIHQNTGGSTVVYPSISLGQKSNTSVTGLSYSMTGGKIALAVNTSPVPSTSSPKYVRLFLSKKPNVSLFAYSYYTQAQELTANHASVYFSIKDLTNMGIQSDDTVYVKAYTDSFWSNSYLDPTTGKYQFPNINETTVGAISFIAP